MPRRSARRCATCTSSWPSTSRAAERLLHPEPAAELGRRKAENLEATGAQAVAAANPGCALQIAVHAGLPVHHPMTLLHASIERITP